MTIRVLLVDDQTLVRAGFAQLLDRDDHIEVVGEAENGLEGLDLARSYSPMSS